MNAVGADILEISRMRRLLENDYFMRRVFSAREREYIASKCTAAAQSAAGIFCAKEAFIKATGVTGLSMLRKSEVLHTPSGAPRAWRARAGAFHLALQGIRHGGGRI